ncbi:MAG: helix-turn-helix transcriptional regulator [Cytophagales bacterium]|nr:helix-turn-helix transcriptional regulator [Cytophagales bacterium]
MSHFSHNLKFWRQQKGLSQKKFAIELGINRGKLATYEEAVEPRQEFLLSLVDNYHINLHYFLTRKMTEGTFDTFFLDDPAQDFIVDYKPIGSTIISKIQLMANEQEFEERRKMLDELTLDVSRMIEEKQNIQEELLLLMKRLKL